jgi:uncharacterized protein YndB with AHSA1/START domain
MAPPASSAPERFVVGCSVRAVIAASPEELWAWIADPTRHPQFAGSGEPQSITIVSDRREGVGTRFEAQQRVMGLVRYVSHSEVVGFEPNRRFHFRVGDHAHWDFLLEPRDDGTLVTHRHRFEPPTQGLMGLIKPIQRRRARQNAVSMVGTLENLARLVDAPPPTHVQVSYEPPTMD